jgi:hypothetical protein
LDPPPGIRRTVSDVLPGCGSRLRVAAVVGLRRLSAIAAYGKLVAWRQASSLLENDECTTRIQKEKFLIRFNS